MSTTRYCILPAGATAGVMIASLLAVIFPPPAWSAVQSTASIRAAAKHFLESTVEPGNQSLEVEVGHVDRRLRMPECANRLEAFVPPGGRRKGRITVGVRCRDTRPWKLFVNAEVRMYEDIVVVDRSMTRGEVISPTNLSLVRRDVSQLRSGYYTDIGAVAGKHIKRGVSHGVVITHRMVHLPASVRSGQRVVLVARAGGLEIRMEGKALASAGIGDVVRVRNRRSKRIVEGVVRADGIVDVPM